MFDGYLGAADLQLLAKAALDSGYLRQDREIGLETLPHGFVMILRTSNTPLIQFKLDLGEINRVERLADGTVPLVTYLRNIAAFLRLTNRPEAEIFERYASSIGNEVGGVPALPEPSTLPEVVRKEAIVHQDDTVPFSFVSGALTVGRSVARISVPRFDNGVARTVSGGAPWLMNGTAWLVAPDLVLTNHHVINARHDSEPNAGAADLTSQALGATVMFDFDSDASATIAVGVKTLESFDPTLDYAVLRLAAPPPNRAPLRINAHKIQFLPSTYLPVNIIQHPRGLSKRVAFRNNLLSGSDDTTIRYFTDTDEGASGSPVCDDNWRVIALHRGAVITTNVNFQGKPTAYVNFGTQIQTLLNDLKHRSGAVHQEIAQANR